LLLNRSRLNFSSGLEIESFDFGLLDIGSTFSGDIVTGVGDGQPAVAVSGMGRNGRGAATAAIVELHSSEIAVLVRAASRSARQSALASRVISTRPLTTASRGRASIGML